MKNIILSVHGEMHVYSVPDKIADHLDDACWYFTAIWVVDHQEKFIKNGVARYNDKDFIEYLNTWETPECPSVFVENLGCSEIPEKYKDCPQHSF